MMTMGDAIAINSVLTYLIGQKWALDALGVGPRIDIEIEAAATMLAEKAHRTLGDGLNAAEVHRLWGLVRPERRAS